LVEERPRGHEVAGVDDDGRQKYEEERASVELMSVAAGGVCHVQHSADDHSEHDQQAALRHRLQQLQLSVVRYNAQRNVRSNAAYTSDLRLAENTRRNFCNAKVHCQQHTE